MSGHSKWHNIKLRKGKQDAERGKTFTKLAREIIVAAKEGGGNPDSNLRLRLAVQKARENSVPQDNIKRAIQRGTGEIEGAQYEEVMYEGFGPGGVAVMVSCFTDNRNRTVAELRVIFSRNGGGLGETGSVGWMFERKGVVTVPANVTDEESLMMATMDAGAEDIKLEDDTFEVISPVEALNDIRQALTDAKIKFDNAEAAMVPKTTVTVNEKQAGQILRMMDQLDDNDDVQQAYSNFDIPDEVMAVLAG